MIRFTKDYHSEEKPDRIVWLATNSLLFNFVNWFINTDDKSVGKPWEKTKQFFVNKDGQQININGASNNLDSKSKKVRELLKLLNSI